MFSDVEFLEDVIVVGENNIVIENTIVDENDKENYTPALSETSDTDADGIDTDNEDLIFLKVINMYGKILLDKAQTPSMRLKKKSAMDKVCEELPKKGIILNAAQIKKKLENLKARLKKKMDFKKTGNEPLNFKDHESFLAKMLNYIENPSISRLPC